MQLEPAGKDLDLDAIDTSSTPGFTGDKDDAEGELEAHGHELDELQEMLFAESRKGGKRNVLLVLQAMDTAGKGGIVRHVVGSVDPQGVKIHGFKAPTDEEKQHDFLWRVRKQLPPPGIIGVFDRSHYEEVLIGRVRAFNDAETIERYYGVIMDFEKELIAGGTKIIKIMLHISPAEQKARLQERLDRPDKYWKFNPGDIDERKLWPDYMEAYQLAIRRTSTAEAPWYVVPADRKWYARLAVQRLLLEALRSFDLEWPPADFDVELEKKRLAAT